MADYPFSVIAGGSSAALGTVLAPSGNTNGIADAATLNAISAASQKSLAGNVYTLQPGNWYLPPGAVNITSAFPNWITARGVTFNYATGSAGPLIYWHDSSNIIARSYVGGGLLGYPMFNGAGAVAGCSGLDFGDMFQFNIEACAQAFQGAGSKGIWATNRSYWTEGLNGVVYVANNAANLVFDQPTAAATATGSFDGMSLIQNINQEGSGDGVVYQNGANVQRAVVNKIVGNFQGNATVQYAALRITGNNAGGALPGYSFISDGKFDMAVENDSNLALPPYSIYFGNANNYHFATDGIMSFAGPYPFTTSNKTNNFSYYGQIISETVLSSVTNVFPTPVQSPDGLIIGNYSAPVVLTNNATITPSAAQICVNPAAAVTGIIIGTTFYSGQALTVCNQSANLITFAAAGTSNVAQGVAATIPALTNRTFYWNSNTSLWN